METRWRHPDAVRSYAAALPRASGEHKPPCSGPWPWARADTHTHTYGVARSTRGASLLFPRGKAPNRRRSAILLASLRPDLSLSPLPHWASSLHEVAATIITPEYNAPVILTKLPARQEPNILLARSGQFREIFVEIFWQNEPIELKSPSLRA